MPSFDVVSTIEMHEVNNGLDQVRREIGTRYDFKGSKSSVELKEGFIEVIADDEMKLSAVQDMLRQRLAKRGISLKSLEFDEAKKAGGDTIRQEVKLKDSLSSDDLKRLNKLVKAAKLKVTCQIQQDQLRVTGKKRDDLQNVISLLKEQVEDLDLQFVNFRD